MSTPQALFIFLFYTYFISFHTSESFMGLNPRPPRPFHYHANSESTLTAVLLLCIRFYRKAISPPFDPHQRCSLPSILSSGTSEALSTILASTRASLPNYLSTSPHIMIYPPLRQNTSCAAPLLPAKKHMS